MPADLKPDAWPLWLGEQPAEAAQLKALLTPYPSDDMICWPVSPRVGSVKNYARDTVRYCSIRVLKPMPEAKIAPAVQLLDLVLEHFADDGHWTRGRYDDGNGGHCLVGALLHLSRKHRLPTAPAIALLQDAMPRLALPLVHFNDTYCGSVAELRKMRWRSHKTGFDLADSRHPARLTTPSGAIPAHS